MLVHVCAYTPSHAHNLIHTHTLHTHAHTHAPFLWLTHSGRQFPERALKQATWGHLAFLFTTSVSLGKLFTSSSLVALRHQNHHHHPNSTNLRVVGRTKWVNSCKVLRKPPFSQKWPSMVSLYLSGFSLNFTSVRVLSCPTLAIASSILYLIIQVFPLWACISIQLFYVFFFLFPPVACDSIATGAVSVLSTDRSAA